MAAILNIRRNNFNNSESVCYSDASHKISAQSNLRFGRRYLLKTLKMTAMAAILDIGTDYFSNSESLCRSHASHQVSAQSNLVWMEILFEKFQDCRRVSAILDIGMERIYQLWISVTPMPPIKFQLNLTYSLGGDVFWRISRWPPWRPSWILEWNDFSNSESLCRSDASHQVSAQSD